MLRKLTALSLMFAITLTGCSSNPASSSAPNDSSGTSDSADSVTATKPINWYINLSWVTGKWGEDEVSKTIKDQTGFDVNLMVPPAGQENQKLTTMIASNDLPDIMTLNWSDSYIPQMISAGMLSPLNTLADEYSPDFYTYADPDVLTWNKQPDGNIYGYNCYTTNPSQVSDPNSNSNYTFLVRKDMYEAIGSPDMSTPEGFSKALKDAKTMFPEVNGKPTLAFGAEAFTPDQVNVSFDRMLQDFLAVPYEVDGQIYDRRTDPEYLTWLKTIRSLTQDGTITSDLYANNGDTVSENIVEGRYFCIMSQYSDMTYQLQQEYDANPDDSYIAIMPPKDSNGDDPIFSCGSLNGWMTSMISSSSPNAANSIQFMTYMMSPPALELQFAGIEGDTYTKDGDQYVMTPQYQQMVESDPQNAEDVTGVGSWAYFCNSEESTSYFQPVQPWIDQAIDIYKPYDVFTGQYEFPPLSTDSDVSTAQTNCESLWAQTLPQLLQADSDTTFDSILSNYEQQRTSQGYDKYMAALQTQLDTNNQKLAEIESK